MKHGRYVGGFVAVGVVATAVYWRTAYPTITWWDSTQYSLASYTLGVPGPPGSLILTLLGWPIARLAAPLNVARALNLFNGVLAALAVSLVYGVALRIVQHINPLRRGTVSTEAAAGAALGALAFAFGTTMWDYAVKFTPYTLTTVFTGLILLVMIGWWEVADRAGSWRYIALLGLLFGLDFSVHRTNSLLMPGVLAWMIIRSPETLRQSRTWLVGVGSLVAGLSLQLLLIPIARTTSSPLVWNDPTGLSRLWSYISLERLGGGFLLGLFPRKSNLFSEQAADFLRVLADNFVHVGGPARALGVVSGVAAIFGAAVIVRRDRRLGFALLSVLLLQSAMTVLYFNIPAAFFRSLDRHYLPVCVTIGVFLACGLAVAMAEAVSRLRASKLSTSFVIGGVAMLVPIVSLADGWRAHDASERHFAADYARNALQGLPAKAIYFTVGDNDTFPILYMQTVEGVRRDVQLVNLSLLYAPEYVDGLLRLDPSLPFAITRPPRPARAAKLWTDTVLALAVAGTPAQSGVEHAASIPSELRLHPKPAFGDAMLFGDVALIDMIRTNGWRRPIVFAITATGSLGWLRSHARLDGLFWRIVPIENAPANLELLRGSLANVEARGFSDTSIVIDPVTRDIAVQYEQAFGALLDAEVAQGNVDRCRALRARFLAAIPPARLRTPGDSTASWRPTCGS